jgi:hypothetical protein
VTSKLSAQTECWTGFDGDLAQVVKWSVIEQTYNHSNRLFMNQLTFALLFSIYTFLVAFTLDIGERSEGNKVKRTQLIVASWNEFSPVSPPTPRTANKVMQNKVVDFSKARDTRKSLNSKENKKTFVSML